MLTTKINPSITLIVAALVALSPLGMDSYLPAIPLLAQEFGVSDAAVGWTVSNYLLGLALGQLIGGACSDQLGRRPIVIVGLAFFALSSLLLVVSDSLFVALLLRFIQGASGGVVMVAAIAMIKDITEAKLLAAKLAQVVFVVMLTPIIAPIIGAAMLPLGWHSIFLLSFGAALLLLLLMYMAVPETNQHITGKLSFRSALAQYVYVWKFERGGVPLARLQALSLSCSALLGLIFVTTSSPIIMGQYQLSSAEFPYAFGAFAVSILIGNRVGKWLVGQFLPARVFNAGIKLQYLTLIVLLAIALLVEPPLWMVMAFMMVAIGTSAAVGPSGSAMFLNLLERNFGSAAAFETTQRFGLGALLGSIAVALPFTPVLSTVLVMVFSVSISLLANYYAKHYWEAL